MQLVRGTTPDIYYEIPEEIDMTKAKEVWFSIDQGGRMVVDRKLSDGTLILVDQLISVSLTQEETLSLHTYEKALLGVRILLQKGSAWANDCPEIVEISDVVKGGVIE